MAGLLDPVQSAMDYRRDATFTEWADVMNRVGVSSDTGSASTAPVVTAGNVVQGDSKDGKSAPDANGNPTDPSEKDSGKGFVDGLATFGMNALGVAGFGVPSALGLGLGVAQNRESLSLAPAVLGMFGVGGDKASEGGIGGYGTEGRGATDPGVAGVAGGVTGRGADVGKNDAESGFGVAESGGGGDGASDGGGGSEGSGGQGAGDGGWANGGLIMAPGDGNDDAGRARVSNGEYVMPAEVVRKWLPLLEALRQTGDLPGDPAAFAVKDDAHFAQLVRDLAQKTSTPAAQEATRGKGLLPR